MSLIFVVDDEVVGYGDRAAFFEVFYLRPVSLINFVWCHWSFWATSHAFVAKMLGGNDSYGRQIAWEFMLQDAIFAPGI